MTLLERDTELAIFEQHRALAGAGNGSLLLITGEAGIGKSALVRELGARLPAGERLSIGSCDPLSTPAAHSALYDLAPDLGPEVSTLLHDRGDPAQLFSAVLTALRGMPGAIVVFEDIHWADEGTLDLLRFISRRIETVPVLVIVTVRSDERAARDILLPLLGELARTPGCRRIVLAPLSQEAVSILIGGRPFSPESLHRRTEGNPFFVTELLASGSTLPPTVSDAVLGRWSRLSPETRPIVQLAAALGSGISVDLINAVAGVDSTAQIDEAIDSGLMGVTLGRVGFRHELTREAIFESITPFRRRELYRAILAVVPVFQPDADPAWLAHYAAGAVDAEAIRHYSVLAAQRASDLGANRETARHYQNALAASGGQSDYVRIPLLESYAAATTINGWDAENLRTRTELIELHRARGDRRGEIEQLRHIAAARVNGGDSPGAETAIRAAVQLLDDLEESTEHARVYATRALLLMLNRDNEEAIDWGNRALRIGLRLDDTNAILRAQNAIGSALVVSGKLAEGSAVLHEAIALASERGRTVDAIGLRNNLGSASGEIFELAVAEAELLETIAKARAADLDGPLSYALAWLALVRFYQGRWDESAQLANESLAMPYSSAISQMMALLARGRLRARRGDPDVWEALDAALALAEPTGTLQRIAPVSAARAEARWLENDHTGTIAEAARAYGLAIRHEHGWHAGELAYWLRMSGVDVTPPFDVADPWWLLLAGGFTASAAEWERRGCPYEAARARFDSGDIDQLRLALRTFEALGAQPMTLRTVHRLRELGASAIPRGPRSTTRANPAGLTSRELDVLGLMRDGSTNAEIGNTLFVSARTVEHHVSSILLKLDVSSRRDAVTSAIARGILLT